MDKNKLSPTELLEIAKQRKSHPFFMYENIHNTPALLAECLQGSCAQEIEALAKLFVAKKFKRVFFGGCGTSLFNGKIIGYAFDQLLGIPNTSEDPFETLLYPPANLDKDSVYIIISHSGNTLVDRQAAELAHKRGATVVVITDNPSAQLIPLADLFVVGPGGRDVAVPKTRSFSTALMRGFMLVAAIKRLSGSGDLWAEVQSLPDKAKKAITDNEELVKKHAAEFAHLDRLYGVGVGPNAWTGLEFGLKMMETNGMPSFGFEVEEYCHGVELSLTEKSGAVFFQSDKKGIERTLVAVNATAAVGCTTALIGNQLEGQPWNPKVLKFNVPHTHDLFSSLLLILPAQLLVYYTALALKKNPDVAGTDNPKIMEAIAILHPPGTH